MPNAELPQTFNFFFFKRVILEAKESKVCLESQKTSNCQPSWGKVEGAAVQGRVSAGLRTWPPQLLIGLLLLCLPNAKALPVALDTKPGLRFWSSAFRPPLISPQVHLRAFIGAYDPTKTFWFCLLELSPRKVSIVVLQSVDYPPPDLPSRTVQCVKRVKVTETTRVLISVSFLSDN